MKYFRNWKLLIFWVSMITIYITVSTFLVLEVSGYRINWRKLRLQKTGLIVLNGWYSDIEIKLNGEKVDSHLPARLNFLIPGRYYVEIEKPGYNKWQKSFNIEPDHAYTENNIVLFRQNAIPIKVDDSSARESLAITSAPIDILVENGEIWVDERLVTRFEITPKFYYWYNDRHHILFQDDSEIRIIDISGYNDTFLVKLSSEEATIFRTIGTGNELLYRDNGKIYKIKLR